MPGTILDLAATALCPHGGVVKVTPTAPRVFMDGKPALGAADLNLVLGCALNIAGAPHPCTSVEWLAPAAQVLIAAQPAVLASSSALCHAGDLAPQGPPLVTPGQIRVVAR